MAGSDGTEPAGTGTDRGGLPLTGERTVPGVPSENYWLRRHEAAYEFAADLLAGRVLDVGCGEGYGTDLLARGVAQVVGVDYDAATVAHARRSYPRVGVVRANLAALPVRTGAVDALASLQVIEHVWDHPQFVRECLRVTRPGGRLVITTPNRLTFSPGRDTPLNPFHTHEFTADELAGLFRGCGAAEVRLLGVHAGARLRRLDGRHGGSLVEAQLAREPARWSPQLTADVASVTTADFSVSDDRLDAALDLVLLARAPG